MPGATQLEAPKPRVSKRGGTRAGRPLQIAEVRARGRDTSNAASAALVSIDKPLTDLQRRFVKLWASGESILSASHRAGYADSGTSAYRMAQMPNILALYNEEKRLYEEAAGMTRKKVMDMLQESYEHAKLAGEPASMVSAAREIGKMCGYYEPVKHRIDISVSGTVMHDRLNRLSDAELLKMLTEGDPQAVLELETPS